MQKLILFTTLAACCAATPLTPTQNEPKPPADVPLERPSPINPELPMPPKPAEKITLITDPVELAQHKREIVELSHHATFAQVAPALSPIPIDLTPNNESTEEPSTTQQPEVQRQKREDQVLIDSKKVQPLKPVEQPTSTTNKPTTADPISSTPKRTYVPRTTLLPRRSKPTSEAPPPPPLAGTGSAHKILQIPQGPSHTPTKRDIPVPLVPKHPHPEESPKDSEESKESEESGEQKKPEVKPHEEQKPKETPQKDNKQPSKVSVKREDVQVEALPVVKPAEEHAQAATAQQQDVKSTPHANHQLHSLHHQFQHAEQSQGQLHIANAESHNQQHKYEHHSSQQQHHAFQPEHPHVATSSTTQKIDVTAAAIDSSVAPSTSSSTSSTSEHPLFRTRPVPVAELFARSHH